MTNIPFVHLHVHTEYSLLDGAIRIPALLKKCKAYEMEAVAITDHGTMFGVIEFYEQALKAGIKPIIGCECYVAPRSLRDKSAVDGRDLCHLILLAENMEGYKNLCRLCTIAYVHGFYYKPRIDKEVLSQYHSGLIATSACLHGEIPRFILKGMYKEAENAIRYYQNLFGLDNFFLEIQNNSMPSQEKVNQVLLELSRSLSVPIIATNDCHYLEKNDMKAHEVLLCIQTGKTIQDSDRFKFGTDQLYFKSKDEMVEHFKNNLDTLTRTADIANRCQVEFDFKSYHFPKFHTDSTISPEELFEQKSREGFNRVFQIIRSKNPSADEKLYKERLDYEIATIKQMGFSGYFLIVADFIEYAKKNSIPVGPGRGSAAGSLVAYALGITDLDPIVYGLIFERFLNPSRISMPDIDVDFCINGRDKVFKYVVDKYSGGDQSVDTAVAQIITFGKMKSRAVIRDVGRALNIPLKDTDALAKLIPEVLNISLDEAIAQEPRIKELADSRPEIAELIEICKVLEGLSRHSSTHAAGVVIGDRPLVEYLPLYKGKKDEIVTQLDMKSVEKIGLVKFDFLGLRNLTVIADTLKFIADQKKTPPDMSNLDLNDPATYRLLSEGDTTGVFQLESSGMKDLLVRLKPACFDDIIALVALYRPGPLDSGMVDDFVERKHGRKPVEYLTPELEPILKETYGVIVYQEQVMKIASTLANYSMAEADGLRKAMGKKIVEIMAKHRDRFVEGAVKNNISQEKAAKIFDLMEKFGGYGFNKSHSAAYALISFQTAYLKAHYPVEFMASLLNSELNSIDNIVKYISECRTHNIQILPPDINESMKSFTVIGNNIRFGLMAVKNVGESAIESIIESRSKNGRFTSIFDFCARVDSRKVNKRVIESLIKCGAFDSLKAFRSQMLQVLDVAMEYGQQIQKEEADPQMNLFDSVGPSKQPINPPKLPQIKELDQNQLLLLEKESLGFYITGHPMDRYQSILEKFSNADTMSIKEKPDKFHVRIGGIIRKIKTIRTKKDEPMAFITIEDMRGSVEVTIFSALYSSSRDILIEDHAVMIEGKTQKDENSVKIIADTVIQMEKAEETWTTGIRVNLDITRTKSENLSVLYDILKKYQGPCHTFLHLRNPEHTETVIDISDAIRLKAGESLKREVNSYLGYNAIETVVLNYQLSC